MHFTKHFPEKKETFTRFKRYIEVGQWEYRRQGRIIKEKERKNRKKVNSLTWEVGREKGLTCSRKAKESWF